MMLRNMVTSLLDHEKIQTTLAKAKEVRRLADRVITLAKKGDLHARRHAMAILNDKGVVRKLFSDIAPRFEGRTGGFTRVLQIGNRLGDAAPLSVVMLTEPAGGRAVEKAGKAPSKKKRAAQVRTKKKEGKPEEERTAGGKPKRKAKETVSQGEPSEEAARVKKRRPGKRAGAKEKPKGNQDSPE